VYDWELTLVDVPQRDLVEFLTFTLSDNVTREQVDAHIERHRRSVEVAAARTVPTDVWWEGWRCELYLEAINRVPLQWVFHTRYPSRYTPRINRVLEHLLDLYADL
jgi:hydroxymethylglutaryl-CoA reductase (NADPH)